MLPVKRQRVVALLDILATASRRLRPSIINDHASITAGYELKASPVAEYLFLACDAARLRFQRTRDDTRDIVVVVLSGLIRHDRPAEQKRLVVGDLLFCGRGGAEVCIESPTAVLAVLAIGGPEDLTTRMAIPQVVAGSSATAQAFQRLLPLLRTTPADGLDFLDIETASLALLDTMRRQTLFRKNRYGDDQIFDRVMRLMLARYGEVNFSAGCVSEELRVPERSLQKIFALRGTTMARSLRETRLKAAENLLRKRATGEFLLSIAAIAYRVGFSDLSYFNRCFRARYGTKPSAYHTKMIVRK